MEAAEITGNKRKQMKKTPTKMTVNPVRASDNMSRSKSKCFILTCFHPAVKKWPVGKPFGKRENLLLFNVVNYLRNQMPRMPLRTAIRIANMMTGVGRHSILRAYLQKFTFGRTKTMHVTRPNGWGVGRRLNCYEGLTCSTLRDLIHKQFRNGELPSVRGLLDKTKECKDLPSFTEHSTMIRLIHDLGFKFVWRHNKSILLENCHIVTRRRDYLRAMKRHRADKKHIVYVDETWVSALPYKKIGADGRTNMPSSREVGLIIIHAASSLGFVSGASHFFETNRRRLDSHEIYAASRFERWFADQLLPNLPANSVIVMDNAPQHCVLADGELPKVTWSMHEVRKWLTFKGISWDKDMVKSELLRLVNEVEHKYDTMKVDALAKQAGHEVMRLPAYHWELNAMELAWRFLKSDVVAENTTYKLQDVKKLALASLDRITPDVWSRFMLQTMETERNLWVSDIIVDYFVDKLADVSPACESEDSGEESFSD